MQILNPIMSPIQFYPYNELPDWSTYWPDMDNIIHRSQYFEGIYPGKFWNDWVVNKQMSIQFQLTDTGTEDLTLYKYNSTTGNYDNYATISPTNITPSSWAGYTVNRYNYTFSATGVYYIESSTAGYRSQKFVVHSDQKFLRRLIQVTYVNSENDYSMVFWDGTTAKYTGLAYFTGKLTPDMESEVAAFITDRGDTDKTRTTFVPTRILTLTDIHMSDIDRINAIFACDTITVNGRTYMNRESPDADQLGKSDLVNIKIKLHRTNYNYFTV